MKNKFDLLTLQISGLSHDGRGIARYQDKVVFVFGALPGESVQAQIIRRHKRYDEAKVEHILSSSPKRVTPRCAHFGICGGCQLQHMDLVSQLEHKQALLAEQLRQQKIPVQQWLAPLVGEGWGYRKKARLGVRYVEKKQAALVGFREQKSNKIAWIEKCHTLEPRIGLKINLLRHLIESLQSCFAIAQVEVAVGEQVALVFRHVAPLPESDQKALISFCQQHQFSLYLQPEGAHVHKVFPLDTPDYLCYTLAPYQLVYQFQPLDFVQINSSMNEQMIEQALMLLAVQAHEQILDLFCGLGNFSLPLAQQAQSVVGVEENAMMVERARYNAQLNKLTNLCFYASDLNNEVNDAWSKQKYHKILVDPPRSGALKIMHSIARFQAKEILYISCNPATFARDAAILVHQHSYQLRKVGVIDMFAHTAHVESMGLFVLGDG